MIGVLLIVFGVALAYFHWFGFLITFTGVGMVSRKLSRVLLLWIAISLSIFAAFILQLPPHARISELTVISLGIFLALSILSTFFGYSVNVELRKS